MHSADFKLKVIKEVLEKYCSIRATARKYKVTQPSISRWIALYKHKGIEGLKLERKYTTYGRQLKNSVVDYMKNNKLTSSKAAAKFGIPASTIRNWKRMHSKKNKDIPPTNNEVDSKTPVITEEDYKKLTNKELIAKIKHLQMEIDYLKELNDIIQNDVIQKKNEINKQHKMQAIYRLKDQHDIIKLVKIASVSRSVYYYYVNNLDKVDKYADIKQKILDIYRKAGGKYGYRRITLVLRNNGILINRKTVYKLMKVLGIEGVIRKKKKSYESCPESIIASNLIKRDFKATEPNQKWGTDVTEISINGYKAYLSVIVDFYNGEIVSYDISRRDTFYGQITNMLRRAFCKIPNGSNLILHSDQGRQFRLEEYHRLLKQKGIRASMSRKGNCLDNGLVESFFGSMKCELLYLEQFDDIDHFIEELHNYLYYYNNERIKTRLKMSPVEYRTRYFDSLKNV